MKKFIDLLLCALIWTAKTMRMKDSLVSLFWAAWWWAAAIMLFMLVLLVSACNPAFANQVPS